MAELSLLPEELAEHVMSYLDQAGLYNVCRLNKTFHRIAVPFLYRHVDLRVFPDKDLPRIDRFCLVVVHDICLASCVRTLQIGLLPKQETKSLRTRLPIDALFDDRAMSTSAIAALGNEPLMWTDTIRVSLQNAIKQPILRREYGAYATIILLMLPNLEEVNFIDHPRRINAPFGSIFQLISSALFENRDLPLKAVCNRLLSINTVSYNFNHTNGIHHAGDHSNEVRRSSEQLRIDLDSVLNLPSIRKLEFTISEIEATCLVHKLARNIRASTITALVVRHSTPVLQCIFPLLASTPLLKSLTYDIFWDKSKNGEAPARWIDLDEWNTVLRSVKRTLTSLALAVEYCDTNAIASQQPRIGQKIYGCLDLTEFHHLISLEIPIPLLTGDVEFSITTDVYPFLPPRLQNLSLRPDMSYAQFSYQKDSFVLSRDITHMEATAEARFEMSARMDNSYMFYATLKLLDCTQNLRTITVWQPADPSLDWFPSQIDDFVTTCKNKSLAGFLLMPMLLRSRKPEQRDLVKEITVFDPSNPMYVNGERLYRGERARVPLGLATQYHLHIRKTSHIRMHDRKLTIVSPSDYISRDAIHEMRRHDPGTRR